MVRSVLFVDDEIGILKALRRTMMNSDLKVFFANSGEEALNILNKEEIRLIISDIRMPNMDGYQLLKKVKKNHPNTIRVILSGYIDKNLVFEAIYKGLAKTYILKPWDNEDLKDTIDKLLKLEDELTSEDLLTIINEMEGLPTITSIYSKLMKYIESDRDIKEIARLIETDQSISSKVLQIANSAYYGIRTGSIEKAVTYLGLENIKGIVLNTSIFNTLNNKIRLDKKMFWEHANISNVITQILYKNISSNELPDTYCSAGLLHDIGKVALINYYLKINNNLVYTKNISIQEVEKEIGACHDKLGGSILNWWDITYPIVECAYYHHDPLNNNVVNKVLVSIVHIADYYSWELLQGKSNASLNMDVFYFLNIEKGFCDNIIEHNKEKIFRKKISTF